MIYSHWEDEIEYASSYEEAKRKADYWEEALEEHAKEQGEWEGYDYNRIEIAKIVEVRDIVEIGDTGTYEMKREIIEDGTNDQVQEMVGLLKRVLVCVANGTGIDIELVADISKMIKEVDFQDKDITENEVNDLMRTVAKAKRWC